MRIDREVLHRLEWYPVQEMIGRFVRTPMGAEQLAGLLPLDDSERILTAQNRVEEIRLARVEKGRLPLAALIHPREVLGVLGVAGKTLSGRDIYETLRLLLVARDTARFLRKLDPGRYPSLGGEWARFPDLEGVIGVIDGTLNPSGQLEDHASAELARVRHEIRTLSERLTKVLEGLLKTEWPGPVLQDRFITQRNNRFVVPVRTDAPRRFPGVVHGHSGSDKTLFVEPMETVDINNQLVRLRDEEEQEVERILAGYTALLRGVREEIATTTQVLGEVDRLEAIGMWADESEAVRPDLMEGGGMQFRQARHPLLEAGLASQHPPKAMVPIDLDLPRELRGLVISGPNAGGKTVALKTVGLLTLMAHAGLPVPARSVQVPFFGQVFADIGDEQSLAQSLSTFASHIRNIAAVFRRAEPPALVLIDEIGTGTDPAEGAALGMAVLDRLLGKGAHVVATTHHAAIKAWAYRTPGATNAACDFDEKTLTPTYHLVPGVAGSSIGLTMAGQLGLDQEVVEEARRRLDPGGAEANAALDAVRTLAADLERQRAEVVELRRQYEREAADRAQKARQEEERRREQWASRLDHLLQSFRAEADRMLSRLTDARERRILDRERASRERELREKFREEHRAARRLELPPEDWVPAPGVKVLVLSLNKEGVVRGVAATRAEVRLGHSVFTVPLEDLRPAPEAGTPAPPAPGPRTARRQVTPRPGIQARLADRGAPRELHLLGFRVDEGLAALDKFLDDASLAGLTEVRIVHGFGTGALKKAVREHLTGHPQVASWRDGKPEEGGGGATVAALAEDA